MGPSVACKDDGLTYVYGHGPALCKIAGMTMPRKVMLDA